MFILYVILDMDTIYVYYITVLAFLHTFFIPALPELAADDQLMEFWRYLARDDVSDVRNNVTLYIW